MRFPEPGHGLCVVELLWLPLKLCRHAARPAHHTDRELFADDSGRDSSGEEDSDDEEGPGVEVRS